MIDLISIEEALQIIKNNLPEPTIEEYALDDTLGKYLAEDIYSPEPSPRYTNSAMDGFAVLWDDICEATPTSPALLKIVGESQAGIPFHGKLERGEAVRISTGAMLATGSDTVVRVEETHEHEGIVTILAAHQKGKDIRRQGEEFEVGSLLLRKGTKISAPQIGLLASLGIDRIKSYKACEVVLLVTGSELVSAGKSIADYQIRDSNMLMLKTATQDAGGVVLNTRHIPDGEQATIDAIQQAKADIIICSGGVSVGKHDHVKSAALANGFDSLFWKIRQKPGKPLFLAKKEKTLLFGLPGNPVSAFMCFTHYVRPVIGTLHGLPFRWPIVSGKAANDIANHGKRTNMICVQLTRSEDGGYSVTNAGKKGSHMLTSLSSADGYIILAPDQMAPSGERIDVYLYNSRNELP